MSASEADCGVCGHSGCLLVLFFFVGGLACILFFFFCFPTFLHVGV